MNDRLNDRLIDELVVQVGGERGWTDDRMPLARWDLQAALDRAGLVLHEAGEQGEPCMECRASHEQFSIIANYLLGQGEGEGKDPDQCRAWATSEALAGFQRLDSSPAVAGAMRGLADEAREWRVAWLLVGTGCENALSALHPQHPRRCELMALLAHARECAELEGGGNE